MAKSFPDLNNDGEVTQADVLKGRGVYKKGGKVKGTKGYKNLGALFKSMREKAGITSYKSGGSVSSASSRGDGIAQRGKTKGRMV
jgi:hypothetical protein